MKKVDSETCYQTGILRNKKDSRTTFGFAFSSLYCAWLVCLDECVCVGSKAWVVLGTNKN